MRVLEVSRYKNDFADHQLPFVTEQGEAIRAAEDEGNEWQIKSGGMIKIIAHNEIDRTEWSALVQTCATGTWFQSLEAYDFFTSQKDIMEPFVVGVEASPQPSPKGKGVEQPLDQPHDSFASVWGVHTADSTQYDLLKANAEANRNNPTEAESILWDMLKSNNIGLHFRRQHIILDYIVDFICIEKGLVIELDGGYNVFSISWVVYALFGEKFVKQKPCKKKEKPSWSKQRKK